LEKSELVLVNLACGGDREAYWRLVQPHLRVVLSVTRSILMNLADAEEVAQQSVLKAFSNIQEFRSEVKFSTWLMQITLNEVRSKLRKDRRYMSRSLNERQTANGDEYVPKDFRDWREIPSAALDGTDLRDALRQALASLPINYREVLTLRDIAPLNIHETAQVLGLTIANAKPRLLRARLQLRDALAPGVGGSWLTGNTDYQRAGT
jgi:RNA polymerase sigma-70 factor, ECF subfamily